MRGIVRVRPAAMGGPCAVRHPDHGELVVPNPAESYAADDPIVQAYPWLFVSDEQLAAFKDGAPVTSVEIPPVEQASRAPGERRTTKRGK